MIKNNPKNNIVSSNIALDYTPEEIATLSSLYASFIPQNHIYEIAEGTIIKIGKKEVILDLGAKADGIVSFAELKDIPNLKMGGKLSVYVEQQEDAEGNMVVSRKKAKLIKAWEMIYEALEKKTVLQGLVKRKIKGGLVLEVKGIECFLPGSQIDIVAVTDFDSFVGSNLEVGVAKINPAKANVVVSRKMLIERVQADQRKEIISNLQEGQVLSGVVKNITDFGAFIDLGGIVGLLHKRDMAWNKKLNDLENAVDEEENKLFEIGKNIEVAVKGFDLEKGYISLSTKLLFWDQLPEDLVEGSIIKGFVEGIEDNYALVKISKGVVSLLHISEMSHSNHIKHPKELISLGQEIEVKVLSIDRELQNMRVGIKQLQPDPWESDAMLKFQPNVRCKAKVRTLTNSGAYLELIPGIEGFLHLRHASWIKKIQHIADVLKKDEEVEVMILSIDQENKLFSFGMKELEVNPWPSFANTFTVGSLHKGTIVNIVSNGAIVELSLGVQSFVPNKDLIKKDKTKLVEGEDLDFVIVQFIEEEQKILLSHTATYKKAQKAVTDKEKSVSRIKNYKDAKSATLGDHSVLQKLKEELSK